jgi:hypothetical protein
MSAFRISFSALPALCLVTHAGAAIADTDFTKAGTFTFSAERLTGFFVNDASIETDGTAGDTPVTADIDNSTSTFALLGNGLEAAPAGVPRLGFDYFVIDSLSIGGSALYATQSETTESAGTAVFGGGMGGGLAVDVRSEEETDRTLLALGPRVGYAMKFSDLLGFWGRGGLTYTRATTDVLARNLEPGDDVTEDSSSSVSALALSLDAELVITPVEHIAIGVGPLFDISFVGDFERDDAADEIQSDGDASIISYGASAGLIVWL